MPDREKVIKGLHDARRYLEDREWVDKSVGVHIDALNDALELLKEQEVIVRCKDCKFSKPDWEEARWCELYDCRRYEKWFCADGELAE